MPLVFEGRQPDGVMVEPEPAIASVRLRASASSALTTLVEPVRDEQVEALVRRLVEACVKEDMEGFASQFASDAGLLDLTGGVGTKAALLDSWRRRFASLDYTRLKGLEVIRPERLGRHAPEEIPWRLGQLERTEFVVVVPFEVQRVGSEKLFPDRWILVLRRDPGGLRVTGLGEMETP